MHTPPSWPSILELIELVGGGIPGMDDVCMYVCMYVSLF